ncbi:hypothetical protein M8542_14300 [Amycolatopsis sp. OK19-0408]|uniref:TROVE domain-containing protein n=1 Tax=Amycolatopsis iheyensis TaxID=2945988 RepID=A0A9X2NB40_9PSEU|nr:hypothetical protein [Amycolatopsis iheyensis]MCR6483993.1 hypothetical protein [Amycolatopsis iheyensis]
MARQTYVELLRTADPARAPGFLRWLRVATPMRYPALVGAAAFAAGRLERGEHGLTRQVIASVLLRADDPGHLLAYWAAMYGPSLPKPVKRGVADAVTRLYDEAALLAYDDGGHHFELGFVHGDLPRHGGIRTPRPLRFGDVVKLVHPRARDQAQGDLFRYALARRNGRVRTVPATLPLVRQWAGDDAEPAADFGAREPEFSTAGPAGRLPGPMRLVTGLRRPTGSPPPGQWLAQLRRAGHADTVLAALPIVDLLARPGGRARLEPLIPHLPLATLLGHLRRFDVAGIGFETAMAVAARIADPAEVRAAGVGPLRFAAAWAGVHARRWEPALAAGARHSLGAVPWLRGRTLVVVQPRDDTRIVFGLALAQRCEAADVVALGGGRFPIRPEESPLHGLIRWHTADLRTPAPPDFAEYDRVVFVVEYRNDEPDVPADVPLYIWETLRHSPREYRPAFVSSPRRARFRGLGDASFSIIPHWEEFVAADQSGC